MASKFLQAIAKEALGALTNLKKTKDLPSGALSQLPVNIPIRPATKPRIKLRGFGGKPPSNPLLEHLRETYSPNPLDPREIVINDEVAIEITPLGEDTARLNTIRALEKGTGAGSRALDLVGKLADRFGTTLEGSAKPFGEGGLDKQQLIEFYRRHGWVSSEDDPADLSRVPRTSEPSYHTVDYLSKMNSCLEGNYSNCKLAVQQTLNNPELTGNRIRVSEDDAIVSDWFDKNSTKELEKNLRSGDILDFNQRHYAIYEGNGAVVQVPEWGAKPERISLSSVLEKWNPPTQIITELFEDGL